MGILSVRIRRCECLRDETCKDAAKKPFLSRIQHAQPVGTVKEVPPRHPGTPQRVASAEHGNHLEGKAADGGNEEELANYEAESDEDPDPSLLADESGVLSP